MKKFGYFIVVILKIAGLGLVGNAVYIYYENFTSHGTNHAKGSVISLEAVAPQNAENPGYKPVVEYKLNGEIIHFTDSSTSNISAYKPGDKVDVIYNPAKPSGARINNFVTNMMWFALNLITGAIFLIIASTAIFALWNRKSK